MQRFREWRESLAKKSTANEPATSPTKPSTPVQSPSHSPTDGNIRQDQPQKRLGSDGATQRMDSLDRTSAASTSVGSRAAPSASPVSTLSFAEMDRLRRERHAIFVTLLSDPETFAQFLRFLPPAQQHELLFICEINQLLEKSAEWDEAEIFAQSIKIANIFLRNADSSSSAAIAATPPGQDVDASVLQVQSIQPATRRHLQACIPLTLPAHLQPAGTVAPPNSAPPKSESSRLNSKDILSMLEVARDQVEEGISKKSLQRFLDLQSGLSIANDPARAGMVNTAHVLADEGGLALHSLWEYTFDDCYAAVAIQDPSDESGGLGYVFRAFLLYLMEDKRHRILNFWAEVQRALAAVKDTDLDPAASPTGEDSTSGGHAAHGVHPSASNDELRHAPSPDSPPTPQSAPPILPPNHSSAGAQATTTPRTLSQLYALYTSLEDAYHKFYPDSPLKSPNFFLKPGNEEDAWADLEDEPHRTSNDTDLDGIVSSPPKVNLSAEEVAANHLMSPKSPYLASASNPRDPGVIDLNASLDSEIDAIASPAEIESLRSSIRELIAKLRPMCVKMDKILRYTFWPQFCKSEYFHQLSKIKRPATSLTKKKSLSRSSTGGGTGSRRGSKDLPALPVTKGLPGTTSAVPPSAVSASTPNPVTKRMKHALVSSLKQQKVTREMLVLECASWPEVQARSTKKMFGNVLTGSAATAVPTQTTERDRLLEYVCVLKSTPVLPPRPSLANKSTRSGGPPLPPRPPSVATKGRSVSNTPAPATVDATPNSTSSNHGILRGNQSLSLFYRYPAVDHTSSAMPAHLIDLAFPLLPDAGQTEHVCTCAHGSTAGTIQCVKDTTKTDSNVVSEGDASSRVSSRSASTASSAERGGHEQDFYGFPITPSASPQVARHTGVSNRLFNLVCTQEDGSLLHGCVLQITQVEMAEEKWDELEYPEEEIIPLGGGIGADVLSRERRKSAERKAQQPQEGGGLAGSSESSASKSSVVSGVGSSIHTRRPSLTMVSGFGTNPPPPAPSTWAAPNTPSSEAQQLQVATNAPVTSAPVTPSSTSAKLSQMFDGFAKDVKSLVERATAGDAPQQPTAPTVASAVPASSEPNPSIAPGLPTSTPSPSPSPAPSVTTPSAASVPNRSPTLAPASSLAAFYAIGGGGAATTSGFINPAASVSGLVSEGDLSMVTPPRRQISRSKAPIVHHHHRVFRLQTQYAIVILTRHPLFNLLRSALTNLLRPTSSSLALQSVNEADREHFRSTYPAQMKGMIAELFDSGAFMRLLTYTRIPRHTLDLFGLAPHVCAPSYLIVPPLDFHYDLLFRCLHPRRLLLVLESLICERRVLLISASNSMLTLAGQALLSLLYPFAWKYLYVPILPFSLFKYLACPTPFLMGIHSCYRRKAREMAERDVVLVDLDHDEVFLPAAPGEEATPNGADAFHLPHAVREQFLAHAARLFLPELSQLDTDGGLVDQAAAESNELGNLPSVLTPEKPSVDTEARKILDPYAAAEAPSTPSGGARFDETKPSEGSRIASFETTLADAFSPSAVSSPVPGAFPTSSASTRSLLLQLEFVKIWSHLLKQFRNFAIHLLAPGGDGIMLFDSPAFLATKPEHYQPFLTTLLNTSYFPAFLHERSSPLGLEPVQRDAFDRYEASLSGARIQVWQSAYSYQRKARTQTGPPFSRLRRRSFSNWIELYQSSGIDPSLHHVQYLAGWNVDTNLTWKEIERMPRDWWTNTNNTSLAEHFQAADHPPAVTVAPARIDAELTRRYSIDRTPIEKRDNLLLHHTPSPVTTLRSNTTQSTNPSDGVASTTELTNGSGSGHTTPRKSSLYRTRRPSNSSRSNSNSRTNSPVKEALRSIANGSPNQSAAAPTPPPFPQQLQGTGPTVSD